MIEITAKQLYDIYRHLPNPEYHWMRKNYPKYTVALQRDETMMQRGKDGQGWPTDYERPPIAALFEIEFEIDLSVLPFEWKPTTDLIIKA